MKNLLRDTEATFDTSGDGLRGVPVFLMDRDDGKLYHARVYSNTGTRLWLDTPLSKEPDKYDSYILGSIPWSIESLDLTIGNPRVKKHLNYLTVEYERGAKGYAAVYFAADQQSRENTAWRFIGNINFGGLGEARLPIDDSAGTGYVCRFIIMGTDPLQVAAVTHLSIDFSYTGDF